jgi:3-hydroxyisobutyrate dehydrogenase-like beta-hydroxyacid dehydrogenase
MEEAMRVGFVGLGGMGRAMCRRLIGAGHELTVYNRTRAKAEEFASYGVAIARSIQEVSRDAEVVVTMLADDLALSATVYGSDGLVASMPEGRIHVAMGTHGVSAMHALDGHHAVAKQILVSAPVIGRPDRAIAGALSIIAAGPVEALQLCEPIFSAMSSRTFVVGPRPESATAIKLANNFALGCAIEVLGEVFALARKYDVNPELMNSVLTDDLFACPAYKVYGRIALNKAFDPAGHKTKTGLKDINLALSAAEAVGVPLPSGNVVRDRLISAIANGGADRDWSVLVEEQARASGIA